MLGWIPCALLCGLIACTADADEARVRACASPAESGGVLARQASAGVDEELRPVLAPERSPSPARGAGGAGGGAPAAARYHR